ncbi:TPA: molecular chaperone [Vibrio vulnificus]|uniref:TorD/DmsD family molecular chaperone n=1 Tax=Vibrio vulnificus TaxID=672 RepID=UPI003241C1D8|nr:molecular chaperone [Vibrio vulnificus]
MDIQPESSLRADIYLLLSTLFRQAPSPALLELLTLLDTVADGSEMQNAWLQLKAAASRYSDEELDEEYQQLFIGIGRGEVVPFASWHLTGSLMEKPLAEIRTDLARLGFERQEHVKEPEDHISALCEVMAALMEQSDAQQQAFFNRHLATWYVSLTKQIDQAEHAGFYLAVSQLLGAFFNLEKVRLTQITPDNKTKLKIEIKNLAD